MKFLISLLFLFCCSCISFIHPSYYNSVNSYEQQIENTCNFSHTETNQLSYITKGHYEKSKMDCYICNEKEIKCI